jgi:hypothetical protein
MTQEMLIVNFKKDVYGTHKHPVYYIWECDSNGNPYPYMTTGYQFFYSNELDEFVAKYEKLGYKVTVTNE